MDKDPFREYTNMQDRLQYYKKEWVLDGATVQKGIHETTEYLELFLRDLLLNEKINLIIETWR